MYAPSSKQVSCGRREGRREGRRWMELVIPSAQSCLLPLSRVASKQKFLLCVKSDLRRIAQYRVL